MKTTNRLETIAQRQRTGRARDLLFACFIALVAIIGATTVGAAVHAASTNVAQR
jgi:beta-lactamase regulating signal transducer with metallopeptidase domain